MCDHVSLRNAALPKMPAETYIDIFVVDRLVYVDLAEDYTQYQEFKSYRRDHAQPGVMKTDIDPKGFEKTKEVLQKIKEMSDGSRSRSTSTSSTSVSSSQLAKNICNQLDSYLRNSHYSSEYRHLRATPMEEVMPQILQYVLLAMLPKSPCRFEFRFVSLLLAEICDPNILLHLCLVLCAVWVCLRINLLPQTHASAHVHLFVASWKTFNKMFELGQDLAQRELAITKFWRIFTARCLA